MADLIENVPAARLFDEMLKLLISGHAVECVKQLRDEGLHHGLLPLLDVILEQPMGEKFVMLALANTDERVRAGQAGLARLPVRHPALARSAGALGEAQGQRRTADSGAVSAPWTTCSTCRAKSSPSRAASSATSRTSGPLQPRFEKRAGKRRRYACSNSRASVPPTTSCCCAPNAAKSSMELADWWRDFQDASDVRREEMLLPDSRPRRSVARAGAAASQQPTRSPAGGGAANDHASTSPWAPISAIRPPP